MITKDGHTYTEVATLREGPLEAVITRRDHADGEAFFSYCFRREIKNRNGEPTTTTWLHRKYLALITKLLPKLEAKLIELERQELQDKEAALGRRSAP